MALGTGGALGTLTERSCVLEGDCRGSGYRDDRRKATRCTQPFGVPRPRRAVSSPQTLQAAQRASRAADPSL